MIKGFFFDLDGTLVDTHEANFRAYKKALEDFDVILDLKSFKRTIGHQARTFLPLLAPNLNESDIVEVANRKAKYYRQMMHLTKLNKSLVTFMELMRKEHALVLVTTAKRSNADAVLEHHNLDGYFDHIITSEDVSLAKPSPESYNLALQKTKLTVAEAIAFEDSEAGRLAAEAAGISVVLIRQFNI